MTRTVSIAAAVVALVVITGAVIVGRGSASGVTHARHIAQQDSRFANGPKAGAAFAEISNVLLEDAKSCAGRHGSSDPRCQARSSAAAYTTVSAFALVGCTQPGVFRARQGLLDELAGISTVDRRGGIVPPPVVPTVPTC